jgi:hypothetical protein
MEILDSQVREESGTEKAMNYAGAALLIGGAFFWGAVGYSLIRSSLRNIPKPVAADTFLDRLNEAARRRSAEKTAEKKPSGEGKAKPGVDMEVITSEVELDGYVKKSYKGDVAEGLMIPQEFTVMRKAQTDDEWLLVPGVRFKTDREVHVANGPVMIEVKKLL